MLSSRLIVVGCIASAGCGGSRSTELPPIQLTAPQIISETDPKPTATPAPKIRIVSPDAGKVIPKGGQITCKVEVEAVLSGRLPEVVNVYFKRGKRPAGGGLPAVVKQQTETTARLELTMAVPEQPGNYSLVAEGIQTIFTNSASKVSQTKFETRRTESQPVDFTVSKAE